jgi:hypothetical protein
MAVVGTGVAGISVAGATGADVAVMMMMIGVEVGGLVAMDERLQAIMNKKSTSKGIRILKWRYIAFLQYGKQVPPACMNNYIFIIQRSTRGGLIYLLG